MYVALEGINGAGKTTQARLVSGAMLELNRTPISLQEPTWGRYGRAIRSQLAKHRDKGRDEQRRLFTLDRREHVARRILPALKFVADHPSFILIQDRCYLSAPAYQARVDDEMDGLLQEQTAFAPEPDLIVVLDVPADVAMERIRLSRGEPTLFENAEYLESVRRRYLVLAGRPDLRAAVLKATESADAVCGRIVEMIRAQLAMDPVESAPESA